MVQFSSFWVSTDDGDFSLSKRLGLFHHWLLSQQAPLIDQLLRFVSDSDACGFVLTVFKQTTQTHTYSLPNKHRQWTQHEARKTICCIHLSLIKVKHCSSQLQCGMQYVVFFKQRTFWGWWVNYPSWSQSKTQTQSHTLTWPASLVDSTQQLDAALVAPVVEDPGQDVEVSLRQRVFEEIPWKIHTQFRQRHGLCHTHKLRNWPTWMKILKRWILNIWQIKVFYSFTFTSVVLRDVFTSFMLKKKKQLTKRLASPKKTGSLLVWAGLHLI